MVNMVRKFFNSFLNGIQMNINVNAEVRNASGFCYKEHEFFRVGKFKPAEYLGCYTLFQKGVDNPAEKKFPIYMVSTKHIEIQMWSDLWKFEYQFAHADNDLSGRYSLFRLIKASNITKQDLKLGTPGANIITNIGLNELIIDRTLELSEDVSLVLNVMCFI